MGGVVDRDDFDVGGEGVGWGWGTGENCDAFERRLGFA